MLIGREYRKAVSQVFSYGLFRLVAIWLIVAACMQYGQAGRAAALVIIAFDILILGLHKAVVLSVAEQTRTNWYERLTNRIFYKLFFDHLRADGAKSIDIDDLFREASKDARADLAKADEDSRLDAGLFDKTGWHWFGGAVNFVSMTVGKALYYGSAMAAGATL